MMEAIRRFWLKSWRISLCLVIGIVVGISVTNHFYSVWGKSIWVQIGTITGLGIVWGTIIYWGLYKSRLGKQIRWKNDRFWPNLIVASLFLSFIRIPTFTHVTPLLFEIEILPNISGESVGIIGIRYGQGQTIPLNELKKTGYWDSAEGMLIGKGAGSRVSYQIISERNGKHWGDVKIHFRMSPTSGLVSIRVDGVSQVIDLRGNDVNGETHVVIPIVPSELRVFLLGLCDLLAIIMAYIFVSVWALQIIRKMSVKDRIQPFLVKVGDLTSNFIKKPWMPPLIIFFYSILAHGLLLLNEGIYSDDHLYVTYLIKRDWNALLSLFDQTGRPLLALMHWPFIIFQDIIFGYKIVIFLLIFLSAILVLNICKRSGYLTQNESLLVAVFSITFPANQFFVAIGMSSYSFLYFIFLLAVYLDVVSLEEKGSLSLWLFAGSVILFFFSFTLSSLLVFFYGYLFVRYLIIIKRGYLNQTYISKESRWQVFIIALVGVLCLLTGLLMDRIDVVFPNLSYFRIIFLYIGSGCFCIILFLFLHSLLERNYPKKIVNMSSPSGVSDDSKNPIIGRLTKFSINSKEIFKTGILGLLPIVNYFITILFFTPYGYYRGYNGIDLSSFHSTWILTSGLDYFNNSFLSHIGDKTWLIVILAFLLFKLANNGSYSGKSRSDGLSLLVIGGVLLGIGIFPYLLRGPGQGSSPTGSYTRNFILLGVPIGIIIVAFFRWAFFTDGLIRRFGIVICFLLAINLSLNYVQSYLIWQGRTLWEKSVVLNLRDQPEFYKNSVIWVDSEFTKVAEIGDRELNEPWVWVGLFRQASGNESHFGGDIRYFGGDIHQSKQEQYEYRVNNYFQFIDDFNGKGISIFQRRDMWLVSDLDPYGCQGILSIMRGDDALNAIRSAGTYYYYKFFEPDQKEDYIKQLTKLKIRHLDTPLATNCIR